MAAFYTNAPLPDTNARQVAQTIRPSSTALLTIDSEDRYTDYVSARARPTSPYNFSITKAESLMPGFMTRIGISEVCFPWVIPNINDKTFKIGIDISAGAVQVNTSFTISRGFYTPAQLAAAIQTAVRGLTGNPAPAFTMQYGASTFGGTATYPCFSYTSGDPAVNVGFFPLPANSVDYPYPATTKQLFDLLGFTNQNLDPFIIGTGEATFAQAIRYVDIVCTQLTNSQAQKDQTSQTIARNMLCRIYLGNGGGTGQSTTEANDVTFCPPGCAPTTLYYNFTSPKQIQWIPNQNIPGFLQFQIYDDAGDLLDNSIAQAASVGAYQYADWSMTMLVSEC